MKKKVLFVCWGNICRSPSAEAIFMHQVEKAGLSDNFEIDSAGTIAAHSGERADARMRRHAEVRGYQLDSISRKFNVETDFDRFDYIVAMDDNNMTDLLDLIRNKNDELKLFKMMSFASSKEYSNVPDPYYTGSDGFELVLDLLEDSCEGLLRYIQTESN